MIQKLKNIFWHLPQSVFWNFFYSFPSRKLTLIGVTGTDGKTTCCTLIQKLLENSGLKCGLISTISSPGLHTTSPSPKTLQKIFHDYQKLGYTHVVCEVTSHALDQYRYWGCHFKISLITNISHEHLDYHKNFDNYIEAKSKLLNGSSLAILNRDDEHYLALKKLTKVSALSYGLKNTADIHADKVIITKSSLEFKIKEEKFITDSNYQYQIYNLLACWSVFSQLNLDTEIFKKTIASFPEVKGRREKVDNDLHLNTIIDFAHTPNALLATLKSLRQTSSGRIIVIFGATGGRDKSKRPLMGKVVSENADIALITADDTRSEKIEEINSQIISGIDLKKAIEIETSNPQILNPKIFHFASIPNRQDAFNLAVKIARAGDTIIACGKGHEITILHGHTEYPWSEAEAFRSAFRLKTENV